MNNVIFHPQIPLEEAAKIAGAQGCRLKYINNRLRAVPTLKSLALAHIARWPGVKVSYSADAAVYTLTPHEIDKA